ncbi:MAG: tetratricopeptide repeat protein [Clostridia bacterium]|nr:tetratricopeptide repeat protein [Clostridia bacterium]
MAKISIKTFINELDSCFAKENLAEAELCLLKWRELARTAGDRQGELTVQNEMTGFYRQTKNEKQGMEAVNNALALIDILGISEKVSSATIYLNAATTMKAFGKSEEAMKIYEKAHRVYRLNLDESDPLFAGFYNNYALALQDLKRYSEAEEYFLKAIKITEKSSKNELETAVSLVNLAHLYYDMNNEDDRVNSVMEKALGILENPDFFGYQKYAFTCRKCAPSFGYFGFFLAEKTLNERADRIYAGS